MLRNSNLLIIQGSPYPAQEKTGIAVVVEFAIKKLGFSVEDIVLYGWSIGGYTTSWAAVNHPQLRGVVRFKKRLEFFLLRLGLGHRTVSGHIFSYRRYIRIKFFWVHRMLLPFMSQSGKLTRILRNSRKFVLYKSAWFLVGHAKV